MRSIAAEVCDRLGHSSSLKRIAIFLLALTLGFRVPWVRACGPDFPNWLLAQGDRAVLEAPDGNFVAELARINLGPAPVVALPPEGHESYASQSLEAELADLRRALKRSGKGPSETDRICAEHRHHRQLLSEAATERRLWQDSHSTQTNTGDESTGKLPALSEIHPTEGLPGEFADYFEGFVAWHDSSSAGREKARQAWERLLARQESERQYKSTWASFMLGKYWEEKDPEKAIAYFKQVRGLAQQGFRDSLGLAAASLGLEARVYLHLKDFEAAIETYLEQLRAGDPTATNSLATAAAKALPTGREKLSLLAKNPRTQKVITAYVISRRLDTREDASLPDEQGAGEPESAAARWLDAVEGAQVKDVDSAEALALAAYRANDMEKASRWIKRASTSPLAQWLQAKLLLRAGKLHSAAALLAGISPAFPIVPEGTNAPAITERKDSLSLGGDCPCSWHVSAERQIHGELGALRLARGEYTLALDSLLNAGFWMDAAYVAERVLTIDELKIYVDRFWPPASGDQLEAERQKWGDSEVSPSRLREKIRYLLARRLTRESQGEQARDYFPAQWLAVFEQLMSALHLGWDETATASNRASALFAAAIITRTNGMELIGTEVAPDWHYHEGDFDVGVTGEERSTNAFAVVVRQTQDELRRYLQHKPDPDTRYHYRYQAAALAWEAAKLLPDNNDQTAYFLWRGGTFLKYLDPPAADFFYKALVRRNRKTVLGAEADRMRWFPILDDSGHIVPQAKQSETLSETLQSLRETETEPADNPEPSDAPQLNADSSTLSDSHRRYQYFVHLGDSLVTIVAKFRNAGVPVTAAEILAANPGFDPAKMKVGQKVLVPANGE